MDTDTIAKPDKRQGSSGRGKLRKTPYVVFDDAPEPVPGFTSLGEAIGRVLGRLLFEGAVK